jgi:hypothetical protein
MINHFNIFQLKFQNQLLYKLPHNIVRNSGRNRLMKNKKSERKLK